MKEQLNTLKKIIREQLARRKIHPDQQEFFAHFTQRQSFDKIDGLDWTSWVLTHQKVTEKAIKEVLEELFPGKEFSVTIGSAFGGMQDYVDVAGKTITLQDILETPKRDAERKQFIRDSNKFSKIVFEKLEQAHLFGKHQLVLSVGDQMDNDEMFGEISYMDWWISLSQEKPPLGRMLNRADYIMTTLCGKIQEAGLYTKFIQTCPKSKTLTFVFRD